MYLSTEWTDFVQASKIPDVVIPRTTDEIVIIRNILTQVEESAVPQADSTDLTVSTQFIPTQDGQKIRALIYQPSGVELPATLLYFHGGGWILGRPETEDASVRQLCTRAKVLIISVDYRLAPENPWPIPINDSQNAMEWAFQRAPQLGGDVSRGLILGGFSAGGHIAATLTVRAHHGKIGVPVRGVLLRAPMLSDWRSLSSSQSSALKSVEENANAPVVTSDGLRRMCQWYNVPEEQRANPEEFPLHLDADDAKGLPPTVVQVSGADPLRDEGIWFYKTLTKAGVKTRLFQYEGMPHGFQVYPLPTARQSEKDLATGVEWILETE